MDQLSQRLARERKRAELLRRYHAKLENAHKEFKQFVTKGLAATRVEQDISIPWQINAHVFAVASLGTVCGAIVFAVFFYSTVSKLQTDLKARGYDFLSFHDTAIIYATTLHLARTLPDAATVLMLPDYGPEPDKIVYYIRDHLRYKTRK